MSEKKNIHIPADKIAEFCKRNGIRKLSLFGSVLRPDFRPDSDIDLLVEFRAGAAPSLRRGPVHGKRSVCRGMTAYSSNICWMGPTRHWSLSAASNVRAYEHLIEF